MESKDFRLSLFWGYADRKPVDGTLADVIGMIRGDSAVRLHTEQYRRLKKSARVYDEGSADFKAVTREAQRHKDTCRCCIPMAWCKDGKSAENVMGFNGLVFCDIDHVPPDEMGRVKSLLVADPYSMLVSETISGTGLRVLGFSQSLRQTADMEYAKKLYRRLFTVFNEHVSEVTGLGTDSQCINVNRLMTIAYDPEVHVDMEASSCDDFLSADVERIGQAVIGEVEAKGVRFAATSHNRFVSLVGYALYRLRVKEEDAMDWAVRRFSADYPDTAAVIRSCYKTSREHSVPVASKATAMRVAVDADGGGDGGKGGGGKDGGGRQYHGVSLEELEQYLRSLGLFRFNQLTQLEEYAPYEGEQGSQQAIARLEPINDRVANTIWRSCRHRFPNVRKPDIESLLRSDFMEEYHPLREYLDSLPPWDGRDYIGLVASQVRIRGGTEEQEYWRKCFRKWFVAILPCCLTEDNVNETVLVLIGRQGIYKTKWLSRLLPPQLSRYCEVKHTNRLGDKDDELGLNEFMIRVMDELDSLTSAEMNKLKSMITAQATQIRNVYDRRKMERKRIASFCATGNNLQFLNDPTGTRRWLPFEVVSIASPYENPLPYDQLYAQALHEWKSGFQFWFDMDEISEQSRHNEDFETPSLEVELCQRYFRVPVRDFDYNHTAGEKPVFVTTADILQTIGGGEMSSQRLSKINIGRAMSKLGFHQVRTNSVRGFSVIRKTGEEIRHEMERSGIEANERINAKLLKDNGMENLFGDE